MAEKYSNDPLTTKVTLHSRTLLSEVSLPAIIPIMDDLSELSRASNFDIEAFFAETLDNLVQNQKDHGVNGDEFPVFMRAHCEDSSISIKIRGYAEGDKLWNLFENRFQIYATMQARSLKQEFSQSTFNQETSTRLNARGGQGVVDYLKYYLHFRNPEWPNAPVYFKIGDADENGVRPYELTIGHIQRNPDGSEHFFLPEDNENLGLVFNSVDGPDSYGFDLGISEAPGI